MRMFRRFMLLFFLLKCKCFYSKTLPVFDVLTPISFWTCKNRLLTGGFYGQFNLAFSAFGKLRQKLIYSLQKYN